MKTSIPVILDTDIGTDIDDTFALAMLLGCPELDLKLVSTVGGDTRYRARLTAKLLQTAGVDHVPIAMGSMNPEDVLNFQETWLEDYRLEDYPGRIYENSAAAILSVIAESSEPVTVIAIGKATNIAQAIARNPSFTHRCRFVGMFGSLFLGYDGRPGPIMEANVLGDPEAFRSVLAAPWLEKIISPLDTCGFVSLKGRQYQQVHQSDLPLCQALIENYRIWSENVTWMTVDYVEARTSTLFDSTAVYLAYARDFLDVVPMRLSVVEDGLLVEDLAGDEIEVALRWKDLAAFDAHHLARILQAAQNAVQPPSGRIAEV